MSTKENVKRKRIGWVYSILPVNIALGPIGTFVSLSLLQSGGVSMGTVYVSLAATVFNAVSIPAAIVWGLASDRLHKRKVIIVTSYAVTTIVLFSFFFARSASAIIFVYAMVSFITAASATPLNLLVMETEPKDRWPIGFARLSLVASLGSILGYLLSAVWAQLLPVLWLIIPLGVLSLTSAAASVVLIQEPGFVFEREVITLQRQSFFHRMSTFPMIFLTVPKPADFNRTFKGLKHELTSYLPLLYISIVIFYFATGIFNTSLVPAFRSHSLTESEVYAVTVAALVAQVISFRYAGRIIARSTLTRVAARSLVLRGASYALLGVASIFVLGIWFIVPTLILYPLSSGVAYGLYYTASNTMVFDSIKGHRQGSALGVYSAIVGVSTTIGCLVSGVVSVYLGFHTTFILAGGLLWVAAFVTARLANRAHDTA